MKLYLTLIAFLAFCLTFYPHLNYKYPFHVDEWFHITEAKMIVLSAEKNWFDSNPFKISMEPAWHFLLASIQLLNLEANQWIIFPAILHSIAVLSAYACTVRLFGRKQALIASLLIALLPTNATMGGPAYLIPVNLSLIFIPIAIRSTYEKKYAIAFSTLLFPLLSHPPSAVVLIIYLSFHFLETRDKNIVLLVAIALALSMPNYYNELKRGAEAVKFDFWLTLKQLPYLYGYLQTAFFVAGFYLIMKSKYKPLAYTSLLLIALIVLYARFNQSYLIPYIRIYVPLMLFMSIIASYSMAKIPKIFLTLSITLILILSVKSTLEQKHYTLISEREYKDFLWIRHNLSGKALLDPWKARAFPFIAEREVYAVMPFGPVEKELKKVDEARVFLAENCTDKQFLIENNISIIYTDKPCNLTKVKENIYYFSTS